MASPQSTTSHDDNRVNSKKNLEQITFRFCSECSNMLYPKEDEDSHKLQFTCRTCQYTEEATSTCVFRNVLNNAAGETAGVTQDVGSDPTVGIPSPFSPTTAASCNILLCMVCSCEIKCSVCGEHNAVQVARPSDLESMTTATTAAEDDDIEDLFDYPDLDDLSFDLSYDLSYDPCYDLSMADQYEFEYEMEKGNRDEDIQPDADVVMV
ncbi:uncharacterized protein E0L32_011290 [Thyridium curvatum]|uniref:DNA-directed RNA polymerase II subunit RPB9-like zinc ribbon domain-containing protein n=1 Tax=Thyridium curvatum TaxID=1093900 RepID=A0A507BI00_9PEZI|nr:uncharacterized protein E0L32_011290 [Thyridium curvatum]TPX19046.1 hypothetical protein E0L32_011290 [Thyridium curvatum]